MITSKIPAVQKAIKNANKKGMRAGVKIVLQAVRALAPRASGALAQSLASKVDSKKGETGAYGIIGPRSKFTKIVGGRLKKPSRYAHFLERGKFTRPFLMPAWISKKDAALQVIEKTYAEAINKAIGG